MNIISLEDKNEDFNKVSFQDSSAPKVPTQMSLFDHLKNITPGTHRYKEKFFRRNEIRLMVKFALKKKK